MNLLHRWQHYFSYLSVRRKLNLLTLLIALGVIALSVIAARMQYLDLTETRKTALNTQVELSYGILQHYHRLAGTGEQAQAREAFEQAVQRFGSFEAHAEYSIWALATGDAATAARLQTEIDRQVKLWNPVSRELNQPVMLRLKAAHDLARKGP